jgi:hypothetical protein
MRCVLSAERASHCSAAFFVRCRSSFSLSKVSSPFSFEAEKRTKKTHKIVLGAFDQNTKISKAPSFSSSLGEDTQSRPIVVTRLFGLVRAHKCCLSFALLVFERFHEAKTSSRRLFSRAIGARASSRR